MTAKERLEKLRIEIRTGCISYDELAELKGLAEHIDPGDIELLGWAEVPEVPEDNRVARLIYPLTEPIVIHHPASAESVAIIMAATEGAEDGRSEWRWFRLANGDLIFGSFPYGETYFEVEIDAATPEMEI